jgi:putative polyketide hydroxylase
LHGWAPDWLLDSYESERRPVAEHNLTRSSGRDGSRRDALSEVRVDLGGRLGHHWLDGPEGRRSTIDALGNGLTLYTGPTTPAWRRAADEPRHSGPPVAVVELGALTARALGISAGGAMLARPDGVPVRWWPASAATGCELQDGVSAAVGCVASPPAPDQLHLERGTGAG